VSSRFQRSRTYPVDVQTAYDVVRPVALPQLFRRRYGVFPPIRETRGQDGEWGTELGQTRTIVLGDGGTLFETITELNPPHAFAYTITNITGPMKPLVTKLDGRWEFTPAGSGTRVTWTWDVHPRSALTAPALPVLRRFFNGYARQALEEAEHLLVP
jgi:hypothetical protein